jgi:ribosome-associated translation inhibitor RaiA
MLWLHRERLLVQQGTALEEARVRLKDKLDLELSGMGLRVRVVEQVRSVYSAFKHALSELEKRLPGIPLDEVPPDRVWF